MPIHDKPITNDTHLFPEEAASRAGCSLAVLYEWLEEGVVGRLTDGTAKHPKIRRWVVSVAAIKKAMSERSDDYKKRLSKHNRQTRKAYW